MTQCKLCQTVISHFKLTQLEIHTAMQNTRLISWETQLLIIGQIFAKESGVSHFIDLAGGDPCQYRHE